MTVATGSARMRVVIKNESVLAGGVTDWPLMAKVKVDHTVNFTAGTSASQFDLNYMQERTVGDGSNDDIDLRGVLTDVFGTTITAAEVCLLCILNEQEDGTANTTALTIGAASNPFESYLPAGTTKTIGAIGPGGCLFMVSPSDPAWTVTATTGEFLRVANAAGAANTYQIGLFMRSA